MLIAICSDIHDNIWKLERALPGIDEADTLLFCGDFCAPFTLAQMANGFNGPIHVVFGNNDGDPHLLNAVGAKAGNVTIHGQYADLTLDGLRIGVNHYPEIAQGLAASQIYDLVCYGHDHQVHQEQIDKTLLLNPGEMMGRFGRSTYLLLDTADMMVRICDVE